MTISGRIVYSMKTDREDIQFICGCLSPHVNKRKRIDEQGKYVYCVSEDGYRYCFNGEDGELIEKRRMADYELLGVTHYPNSNGMLSYSQKGDITAWRTYCVC